MANKKSKSTWGKIRKFLNDIHLWAGLISGIVLLVVCFTGTIYVYNTEIRELGASHLYWVKVPEKAQQRSPQELLDIAQSRIGGQINTVKIPPEENRSIQFTAREAGDRGRFGTTYFFDPYTGEMLGNSKEPNKAAEWMGYLFSLHRWLLLDKIEKPLIGELENRKLGSYITGTATILFTFGVLTGIIIWVPRKARYWKQGLTIKTHANWKRVNHDLHNTLAFYSAIVLFLMGVTGPFWSFPWYREGLQKTLGTYQERSVPEEGRPSSARGEGNPRQKEEVPFVLEDLLFSADQLLPYRGEYTISLSCEEGHKLTISKRKAGFFAPAASDRVVLEAGKVADVDIFRDKPFNERISRSIKALHVGDVYGSFSKLIYFVCCLVATSLPVTGTLIWINKMKKNKKKGRKLKVREWMEKYQEA
jgi:uncharacterized iron-regulated membrane protein